MSDVNPIHNVIEHIHELRRYRRHSQLQKQLADRLRPEMFLSCCINNYPFPWLVAAILTIVYITNNDKVPPPLLNKMETVFVLCLLYDYNRTVIGRWVVKC